jgi:hypothetical protein
MARVPIAPPRCLGERAAAEAFVFVMRRWRVREHTLAAEAWVEATGRPAAGGTSREVVRRYRMAPPFWPLTVDTDEPVLTGYAVNTHAVVIRYAQRDVPISAGTDEFTSMRTEFGPGCRELFVQASGTVPAFVCEIVSPEEARQVVESHLVDAMRSLIDGRGPLVISGSAQPPPSPRRPANWNAEAHGNRVQQDHQRGTAGQVRL